MFNLDLICKAEWEQSVYVNLIKGSFSNTGWLSSLITDTWKMSDGRTAEVLQPRWEKHWNINHQQLMSDICG